MYSRLLLSPRLVLVLIATLFVSSDLSRPVRAASLAPPFLGASAGQSVFFPVRFTDLFGHGILGTPLFEPDDTSAGDGIIRTGGLAVAGSALFFGTAVAVQLDDHIIVPFSVAETGNYSICVAGYTAGRAYSSHAYLGELSSQADGSFLIYPAIEVFGPSGKVGQGGGTVLYKKDLDGIGIENGVGALFDILKIVNPHSRIVDLMKDGWELITLTRDIADLLPVKIWSPTHEVQWEGSAFLETNVQYTIRVGVRSYISAAAVGSAGYALQETWFELEHTITRIDLVPSETFPPPFIASLECSPPAPVRGSNMTLVAADVMVAEGRSTAEVEFYRDTNADRHLEPGIDHRLASDTTGPPWSWQTVATWPAGVNMFFARARDNQGVWSSQAASVDVLINSRSYPLSALAGSGGSLTPSGPLVIEEGTSQSFTAEPDASCEVDGWYVDGVLAQTGGNVFTLESISSAHSLYVVFKNCATTASSISVLSPREGQIYAQRSKMPITWTTSGGVGSELRLELFEDTQGSTIDDCAHNSGWYLWQIPQGQAVGDTYRIRVSSPDGAIEGWSGAFEIVEYVPTDQPIYIRTLEDLRLLQANWGDAQHPRNGYYILANDIDANASSSWNGGRGFKPLGTGYTDYFRGVFDGRGNRISNLSINRPDEPLVGMFAVVMDSGLIKNLRLDCDEVYGRGHSEPNDDGAVGALAGHNAGTIINCHVTTEELEGKGGSNIGGLVGENWGGVILNCSADTRNGEISTEGDSHDSVGLLVGQNTGTIRWCYTQGELDAQSGTTGARGHDIGGIVGANYGPGMILECYSGARWIDGYHSVGGIAGLHSGGNALISDCYWIGGTVDAYGQAGGIAGEVESGGIVQRCYVSGSVDGSDNDEGCLIGENEGHVSNSFWNSSVCAGPAVGDNRGSIDNCRGLEPAALRSKAAFLSAGWDLETIWDLDEGISFPWLRGIGDVLAAPAGIEASLTRSEGVSLTWQPVPEAAAYQVFRSDSVSATPVAISGWLTPTVYVDAEAAPNTTFYYSVVAAATIHGARQGEQSPVVEGRRLPPPLPAPTGLSATDAQLNGVVVIWQRVDGASHYKVYRSDDEVGSKTPISGWQGALSYIDSSGVPEQTYFYWVTAAADASGSRASAHAGPDDGKFFVIGASQDTDGDGVPDASDECPMDPGKVLAGVCGCGVADIDLDGDGVMDCIDNCPSESNPDQADGDGDGVGTACDADENPDTMNPTVTISSPTNGQTFATSSITVSGTASDPGSPSSGVALVEVRVNGGAWQAATGITSWSKLVTLIAGLNMLEARSNDKAGHYSPIASVNVTYDESTNSDGDGIVDDQDNCPNDPNKTEPGQCGCGEADTDSDGDGTADCNDTCPDDEFNDADGDGVCGDVDNCPNDANSDQADEDGDGVGDDCDADSGQPIPNTECGACGPMSGMGIPLAALGMWMMKTRVRRRR